MDGRTTNWWRDGKKSPIDFHLILTQQCLSIMILHTVVSQLTSGLSSLPREVKSSNIIWNPVNGSPKLYEFRTRRRWSGETQKIERIGHSRWSLQDWAHWPKTQIYFYFFIFLGTKWANLVFIPKNVILYCSITGNPAKHPFELMVSSILTERIHIHCLWRSSLLGSGMNLKTDKKEEKTHMHA